MGLPAAIQAQVDFADGLFNQEPPEGDTPPVEQHVEQPQPEQRSAPEPREDTAEERKWEAKFHTLQGKYNAEVPRLTEQVRELVATVRQLTADNERLREQPQVSSPQSSDITDSEREAFGEDLIGLADKIAEGKVAQLRSANARLMEKLEQLEGQVGTVNQKVQVTDLERCKNQVTSLVPDWETINTNEQFLNWLDESDPITRYRRQDVLDDAIARRDAAHIAAIFNGWKDVSGYGRQQNAQPNKSKQGLESQVAPTRSRGTVTPANQNAGKIWTGAELADHYQKMIHGRYQNTQEAESMEAEVNAAVAEGRVRP